MNKVEINDVREIITEYEKIKNDKRVSKQRRVNANLKMRYYQNKLSIMLAKQPIAL